MFIDLLPITLCPERGLTHIWNKNSTARWLCIRCGKRRRAKKKRSMKDGD